jgi:phosphocarrier protein HPr
MSERHVKVESSVGLHARPAAEFVKLAAQAPMEISVGRFNDEPVNAKSILAVLGLDARHGEQLRIIADGDGADDVLEGLAKLISESNG